MAWAAVRFEVVILLMMIHCLLLLPCVGFLFYSLLLIFFSSFVIILLRYRELLGLLELSCHVAVCVLYIFSSGAMGWSVVYAYDTSWSYSSVLNVSI